MTTPIRHMDATPPRPTTETAAAAHAEPQPSRRPTPHGAATKVTTTATAQYGSSSVPGSQPRSAHTSPHPASRGSGEMYITAIATAAPRTATRTVSAVAVHPPLARGVPRNPHSLHSTPLRPTPQQSSASGGVLSAAAPPPPAALSQVYATPHARLTAAKARSLSQLQLQPQRGGGSGNSPLPSAATPHIATAYTASPLFQRVTDTVTSPMQQQQQANTPHAPHGGKSAGEEQENSSLLLQEVTPIIKGGDSWRQDSQLLSHPREGVIGSRSACVDYLGNADGAKSYRSGGGGTYEDPVFDATLPLSEAVSQLHRPPPPSSAVLAASAAAAGVAGSLSYWDAAGCQAHTSPFSHALYYPPGFSPAICETTEGKAYTSPCTPGNNGTRLSASPGGLTGSRNATMQLPHLQNDMQAAAAGMSDAVAAQHVQQQPSFLHDRPPAWDSALAGGSPPDFYTPQLCGRPPYQSPITSVGWVAAPMQHYSGGGGGSAGFGPVQSMGGSPAAAPVPAATAAIASGLSGVALEKQLLHAAKEELVQILLELGSCNPDAARFIDAKAFFFAFRNEHRHMPTAAPTSTTPAAKASTAQPAPACRASDTASTTTAGGTRSCDEQQASRQCASRGVTTCGIVTAASTSSSATSSSRSIARCIFPAEAADDDDEAAGTAAGVTRTVSKTAAAAAAAAAAKATPSLPPRRVRPEERDFSVDVHPCLRWYGACRNSTSCAYAALPRNLCLNWVRGACVAHRECSGVHRLPDPCPPELKRIYLLHHGVARSGAGEALRALATAHSSSVAAPPSPPPASKTDGPPTTHNRSGSPPHTPEEQSIHKEAVVGVDSTPHRRPMHRSGRGDVDYDALPAPSHPWLSVDAFIDDDDNSAEDLYGADSDLTGEAATPYLCALHARRTATPHGSSCSTDEDREAVEPVCRCLRDDFDSAASKPLCESALETCAGRRSPVLLPLASEGKAPLRSVAAAVQELREEEEDYHDVAAPAAGTRTRVQSPAYA